MGLVAWVAGLRGGIIDTLAVVLMIARVAQSLAHIVFEEANLSVTIRFAFFLAETVCFAAMRWIVINAAPG